MGPVKKSSLLEALQASSDMVWSIFKIQNVVSFDEMGALSFEKILFIYFWLQQCKRFLFEKQKRTNPHKISPNDPNAMNNNHFCF